jgi:O-antigen ligase
MLSYLFQYSNRNQDQKPNSMMPIALLAAPAAAIWWILLVRRGGLMVACLLTLAAGICFGAPFFQVGLITSERLLLGLTGFTYLVLRHLNATDDKPLSLTDACVGLFLAVLIFSTYTHDWKWDDSKPVARLLFYYILPIAMYVFGRQMRVEIKDVRLMLWSVATFGLYLALTSIAEKFDQRWAVFPRYIMSPTFAEFLGRGRGPLLNPSGNGILICLGFFSLLSLWPHVGRIGKAMVLGCSVVFMGGVICTMTRCVWLGAMIGMAIVILLSFPARLRRVILVTGIISSFIVAPLAWSKLQSFKRDKNVSVTDMQQSASLRPILAYIAWEMFKDYPLTGVGLGQYKNVDKYYLNDRSTGFVVENVRPYHQHNVVLSLLTETGLLGTFLFIAMFAGWLRSAYRLWCQADLPLYYRQVGLLFLTLFAAYFANGMFQDVTIVPMVHMTLFFFAGVTMGLYLQYAKPAERAESRRNRLATWKHRRLRHA